MLEQNHPEERTSGLECQCSDCEIYERIVVNLAGVYNHYKCYREDSYLTPTALDLGHHDIHRMRTWPDSNTSLL
jgi:hypothetical protein